MTSPEPLPSGAAIKQFRRSRGLSQAGMATMLGRTQQSVSAWERGDPSLTVVLAVVEALDISDDEIDGALPALIRDRLARLRGHGADRHRLDPDELDDPAYWYAAQSGSELPAADRQVIIDLVRSLRAKNGLH